MRILPASSLGRKNYLFAGADSGGDRAASLYTIVATCKLNGVNLEAYLRGTLTKIAAGHPISRIGELMPWYYLNPCKPVEPAIAP
jgi:transposase